MLSGRTPASIRLPSCSPASSPLRAGFAGGLRPGLTQAARDGADDDGRDGETLRRTDTEKQRSTEQRNTVTMGVAATQDSTSDWREEGAQVIRHLLYGGAPSRTGRSDWEG